MPSRRAVCVADWQEGLDRYVSELHKMADLSQEGAGSSGLVYLAALGATAGQQAALESPWFRQKCVVGCIWFVIKTQLHKGRESLTIQLGNKQTSVKEDSGMNSVNFTIDVKYTPRKQTPSEEVASVFGKMRAVTPVPDGPMWRCKLVSPDMSRPVFVRMLMPRVDMSCLGGLDITPKTSGLAISAVMSMTRTLRASEADADVTFLVEGETVPAHSVVLAAQSDVFRSMLTADMAEAHSRQIQLADFSAAELRTFLDLLYTGVAKHMQQHHAAALRLADKYLAESVRQICVEYELSHLTPDSAVDTAINVRRYGADEAATNRAVQYIVDNRRSIKDDCWQTLKELNELDLFASICSGMAKC